MSSTDWKSEYACTVDCPNEGYLFEMRFISYCTTYGRRKYITTTMPAPNSDLSDLEKIRQSISSITSISSFDDVLAAVGLLDMPQGEFFFYNTSEGASIII